MRDDSDRITLSYGINDCESAAATLTLARVKNMLVQHDPSEREQLEKLLQKGDGAQPSPSGAAARRGVRVELE